MPIRDAVGLQKICRIGGPIYEEKVINLHQLLVDME
jgi:hypothetical protein